MKKKVIGNKRRRIIEGEAKRRTWVGEEKGNKEASERTKRKERQAARCERLEGVLRCAGPTALSEPASPWGRYRGHR
mgnify:FL=1